MLSASSLVRWDSWMVRMAMQFFVRSLLILYHFSCQYPLAVLVLPHMFSVVTLRHSFVITCLGAISGVPLLF